MPDNETKITLTGEDKTAPMFKGASKNAAEYIKQLEKILDINDSTRKAMEVTRRTTHQTYKEQLENVLKHNRAYNENLELIKKHGQEGAAAFKKQESAAHLLTGELASMVGGYLSVSAAIQTATKAFMGFADQQRRVNQLRNATDMTKDAAQGAIKAIEQMAQDSATSVSAANEAFTTLKEGLNLTANETLKILPRVLAQAQASNSSLGTFSKTFAEYARALKIPQEDYGKALEQMTYLANELGVNLDKAGGSAEKLGTWANRWGQTGIKGMASMNAVIAESSKLFGNSQRGAEVAAHLFEQLSSDQWGEKMQKPAGVWTRELEKVKARGGNVYGYMISRSQDLMTAEQRRMSLSLESQELFNHLAKQNDGTMANLTAQIEKQSGGFKGLAQALNVMNDQRGGIEKLNSSLQILLNTVGDLLDKLGVSDAMTIFNEQLIDLNHTIDELKKGNWGVLTERTGTPGHTTIFGGMDAAGLLERGRGRVQKRLEATMSEDEKKEFRRQLKIQQDKAAPQATLPGLKEPGIPAPPGYDGFKPMSFNQGGGPTPSGGAMPGGVTPAVYGGSADSAFLPAGYRNASFVTQGQSGARDRSYAGPAYQQAGPAGPGVGTGYGGQRDVRTASRGNTSANVPAEPGAPAAGAAAGTMNRERLNEELKNNPELADRLQTIVQGEVGHGASQTKKQIALESIFNRATARGQTLAEVTQEYTGPGSKGYYPRSTFTGGAIKSAAERAAFQKDVLEPVKAGSDLSTKVLGFPATGNASAGVAARGVASGRYQRHGQIEPGTVPGQRGIETWVQQETEAQRKRLENSRVATAGGNAPATAAVAGGGGGNVSLTGSGRMVDPEIAQSMSYAGAVAGVSTSIAHGDEGGHARHRHGASAGDIDLMDPATGRKLDARNPADREKMAKYIEAAAASGSTGIGFGKDGSYMGHSRMHVGGGTAAVWGAGGRGANAPAWVREAYERGRRNQVSAAAQRAAIAKAKEAAPAAAAPAPAAPAAPANAQDAAPVNTLYDPQTGEYIPGTGAGFGAESRRESWNAFRGGGNIEDRRGDAAYRSRGASRNRLANQINMPWRDRKSEYLADNPVTPSTDLGRQLGTDDLDKQMNQKVSVNLKVNDNDVQFARTSMKRQADREVREARWSSYSDIGAA